MPDIEYEYSHSSYTCDCPLAQTDAEEIALAQACHRRELEHEAAARRPDHGDGAGEGE